MFIGVQSALKPWYCKEQIDLLNLVPRDGEPFGYYEEIGSEREPD